MSSPPLHTIFIIISIIYIFFSSRVSITRRGLITFSPTFTWGFITPFYFYIQFGHPIFYCSFYVFYTLLINFFFNLIPCHFIAFVFLIQFCSLLFWLLFSWFIFLFYFVSQHFISFYFFIQFWSSFFQLCFFYHFLNLFYFLI
jgi:hypothetical protein